MAMQPHEIKQLLIEAFPDSTITLVPLVQDGEHYQLEITSQTFANKNRVQQHQLVHKALAGKVGTQLHALSIKTLAP